MLDLFIADAAASLPNESGAWLIWDDLEQRLKYRLLHSIAAGPGHLKVERPGLADHESLAVDLHSHGYGKAFFSPDDDADDRREVKISVVVGSLASDKLSLVSRLCSGGRFITLGNGQ